MTGTFYQDAGTCSGCMQHWSIAPVCTSGFCIEESVKLLLLHEASRFGGSGSLAQSTRGRIQGGGEDEESWARIAISRTQGRVTVVAAGMEAVKVPDDEQ